MKERHLTLPEIGLIALTRVALGIGIGFLFADYLTREERLGAGWALVIFGVLSTIPLMMEVFGKRN